MLLHRRVTSCGVGGGAVRGGARLTYTSRKEAKRYPGQPGRRALLSFVAASEPGAYDAATSHVKSETHNVRNAASVASRVVRSGALRGCRSCRGADPAEVQIRTTCRQDRRQMHPKAPTP